MKVIVGCDHAGFEYKKSLNEYLSLNGINFNDLGTNNCDSVDYPDYAHAVAKEVQKNSKNKGVLICGSANGVAITANKHKGIRAAICWNEKTAELAATHNNANIICMPSRFIKVEEAIKIIESFILEKFEGGRHERRIKKINENLY